MTQEKDHVIKLLKKLGRKYDRRKNYKIIDKEVCEIIRFTRSCSGCCETVDGHNVNGYPVDKKHGCLIGMGCHECGYTGKVRHEIWSPMLSNGWEKD